MTTPAATSIARLTRHAVCAALALALGITCAVLAVAVSAGMSGMNESPSTAASPATTAAVATEVSTASVAAGATQQMTSMCEDVCAGVTASELCTAAAGFLLAGVLVLLLASPRHTFLGLLARTRRPELVRRQLRQRTPWLVRSPASLCVFRV